MRAVRVVGRDRRDSILGADVPEVLKALAFAVGIMLLMFLFIWGIVTAISHAKPAAAPGACNCCTK